MAKEPAAKASAKRKPATKTKAASKKKAASKTTSNKTTATALSPAAVIAAVQPEVRRKDAETLLEWFEDVSGYPPVVWSGGMIGYGRYRYSYKSGRTGEWFMTGFAARKSALSIHILPGYGFPKMADLLAQLGKHKTGAGCLYITRLDDIDMGVLRKIVEAGLAEVAATGEVL